MEATLTELKQCRRNTLKHVVFDDLSPEDRFRKLGMRSKYFIDTIKMNGDFLPYASSWMTNDGINYWYVEAAHASGTIRYPTTGSLSFTVRPRGEGEDFPWIMFLPSIFSSKLKQ